MSNGKHLTVNFYGENIFRLFRDDNGGIIRDPQATPPAQTLVNSPRRATGTVELKNTGQKSDGQHQKLTLSFDCQTGLMTLTNKLNGQTVAESVQPVSFDKDGTTLVLKAQPNEYLLWRQRAERTLLA